MKLDPSCFPPFVRKTAVKENLNPVYPATFWTRLGKFWDRHGKLAVPRPTYAEVLGKAKFSRMGTKF